MLPNFICKRASGYFAMKNEYAFSVERKALDGMLACHGIIDPNDGHDYVLRIINHNAQY